MEASQPRAENEPGAPPLRALTLLEDDEVDAYMVGRALMRIEAGCVLERHSTLRGFRRALREHCPEIALVDRNLPDGSGIDAIRDLRESCPSARIYLFTSLDETDELDRAIAAGADGAFTKPANGHEFAALVLSLMRG
ncbi:MAG: response regulator [Actinomycetota bacterium]|nr:response regulator [Actinomycetota bacterium]